MRYAPTNENPAQNLKRLAGSCIKMTGETPEVRSDKLRQKETKRRQTESWREIERTRETKERKGEKREKGREKERKGEKKRENDVLGQL